MRSYSQVVLQKQQHEVWVQERDKRRCEGRKKKVRGRHTARDSEKEAETEKRPQQSVEWVVSHPTPLRATSNWIRLNIHPHLLTVNYIEAPIEKLWWCGCVCSTPIPHAACCLTSSSVKSFILSILHCLLNTPSLSHPSLLPLSVPDSVFQLAQNLYLLLHNHLHCQTKQHGRNDACSTVLQTHVHSHITLVDSIYFYFKADRTYF